MRPLAAALLVASAAVAACSAGPDPAREIDNVAAFARLYGAARYFYPSDAAAELDWRGFAVHDVALAPTVEDVRAGRDPVLEEGLSLARAQPAGRRPPPSALRGRR